LPFRLLPAALRGRIAYLALLAAAARPPREALRELLTLDATLDGLIDEAAQRYDGGVHAKHRLTGYHEFFVARVKPGERVLDVGCGYGAVAHSLATRADAVVVGVDLDEGNIADARRRFAHPRLTFVTGDATRGLPDGGFDVVVASNVVEHIERRVEFYRAVQDRARPSRWLVRVPMIDREWQVPLRRELGLPYFSDPTHHTEYTRATFEHEVHEAGLRVAHLQVNWGELWAELVPVA
jgi:2-polyprenyl-3-methyl-5-hydroxy-6-metoxy-1,4-benzoquinol methylase